MGGINVRKMYIILGLSLLVNVLLSIYLIKVKPICDRYHIDEIDWSYDEVPDEVMAWEIADAVEMERISHEVLEEHATTIDFDSQENEWEVTYEFEKNDGLSKKDIVRIRKDNGLITMYRRICWEDNEE